MDKTYEQGVYDERMRIGKEMRINPFRWCSVCLNIPCSCNKRRTDKHGNK